jgi:hypothetical protein
MSVTGRIDRAVKQQEHIHLPFCGLVQFPLQVQALVHFL